MSQEEAEPQKRDKAEEEGKETPLAEVAKEMTEEEGKETPLADVAKEMTEEEGKETPLAEGAKEMTEEETKKKAEEEGKEKIPVQPEREASAKKKEEEVKVKKEISVESESPGESKASGQSIELQERKLDTAAVVRDAPHVIDIEDATPALASPSVITGGEVIDVSSPTSNGVPEKRVGEKLHLEQRQGADLTWSDLRFSVGEKEILHGVEGMVPAGKLCAILGPSGAGKTSLLNILAGRVGSRGKVKVEGEIRLNDKVVRPTSIGYRQNIAYVMQDDALPATDTPREALTFSANLRLPRNTSKKQIGVRVNSMLDELGLQKCADVLIGNELIKGISGGERKRTSVGVELITHPSIVFLDEPTSGLDSFAAYNCIQTLSDIAHSGSAVLCTVHQPSSEIFDLFDWVILLSHGRIVYSGPVEKCGEYFASKGYPCPVNYNVADHIMFTVQKLSLEESEKAGLHMTKDELLGEQKQYQNTKAGTKRRNSFKGEKALAPAGASFIKQLALLSARELRSITRNKIALVARFGITAFISLLFGTIFFGAGGEDDTIPKNLNAHFGALSFTAISAMFGAAQPALLNFPSERPIFLREYSVGTYDVLPYFLSKTVMELPVTFANNCVQFVIVYYMVDFQGVWILQVLSAWALACAAASVAVMLGCVMSDVKTATEVSPLLFVPQLLFAGFFINIDQMPEFLQWVQYTCSLKYALNLLMLTEFNEELCIRGGTVNALNCAALLEANDVREDQAWVYLGCLIALFVGFRIIGAIFLMKKARTFY